MSQVKSEVRRAEVSQTLRAMQEAVSLAQSELADLSRQADELSAKRDTLQDEIETLRKERRTVKRDTLPANDTTRDPITGQFVDGNPGLLGQANDARQAQKETRQARIVGIIEVEQGVTYTELAERLGVSLATVKRDVAELTEAGKVRRNGHGLEPVSLGALAVSNELASEPVSN